MMMEKKYEMGGKMYFNAFAFLLKPTLLYLS